MLCISLDADRSFSIFSCALFPSLYQHPFAFENIILMSFYVYIIYSDLYDIYYKGQTKSLQDRLKRHNNGLEKYTASYRPWKLVWFTEKRSRKEALILEKKLKNLNREKLLRIIQKYT